MQIKVRNIIFIQRVQGSRMELSSEIDYRFMLEELIQELDNLPVAWKNVEEIQDTVRNIIEKSFSKVLQCQCTSKQQDLAFRNSLFSSLENVILAALHDKIFYFLIEKFREEDELIYKKCCDLSALKVTPDQLGALEDYCIPLPATVVELASLDMHESPADKLNCLSTAFDLAMAELKGAIVDVIALSCDHTIPTLNVSDITPILATILIHAKPMHLISNLNYIENFYCSELTNTESECLLAFKTAVDKIKVVTADLLQPRSTRIYCDIGLEDVFKLTSNVDEKYDRNGRRICAPDNPLERHIEHFTNMVTASTMNDLHT